MGDGITKFELGHRFLNKNLNNNKNCLWKNTIKQYPLCKVLRYETYYYYS